MPRAEVVNHSVKPVTRVHADHVRENTTDAVHKMWQQLRQEFRNSHFRRQVVIAGSVTDFASHAAKLVIEIDGGQHSSERDTSRARMIEGEGYRVLRFWNNDVLQNMPGVCEYIHMVLNSPAPANEK